MRRIHCFTLSALLLSNGFVAMAKNGESVSRPNVIYILCDDLGYGELGYNGQKKIQTPELDNLASKGMILRNHYCANAVSAASRCGLMISENHSF